MASATSFHIAQAQLVGVVVRRVQDLVPRHNLPAGERSLNPQAQVAIDRNERQHTAAKAWPSRELHPGTVRL